MHCRFKKPRSSTRPAHSTPHFLFVWTGSVFFPIRFLLTDPLQCFFFLNWIANQKEGEGELAVFSSLKGQASVGFVQSWHWPRCFLLFKIGSCNNSSSEEMGPGETKGRLTQLMGWQCLQLSPGVPASCCVNGRHVWREDQSLDGEAESQPSGGDGQRTKDKHLKNRAVMSAQVLRNSGHVLVLLWHHQSWPCLSRSRGCEWVYHLFLGFIFLGHEKESQVIRHIGEKQIVWVKCLAPSRSSRNESGYDILGAICLLWRCASWGSMFPGALDASSPG